MPKPLPEFEYLRFVFDYDPEAGFLIWKARHDRSAQWNGRHAGKNACSIGRNGRIIVNLGGKLYLAHRLIWKWNTGRDPTGDIDHRDGNGQNNRWDNLREATKDQNLRNSRLHRNKALPKGVTLYKGGPKFRASIYVNKRHVHLGVFSTKEAAHDAYKAKATEAFGEFARFG